MAGARNNTGQIEVTFGYRRHVGGRFVHGCVTLQFDALRPYDFISEARWPASDNYEAAIREAVEETLREFQGHLKSPRVRLIRIEWDDIDSDEGGFRKAAAAATRAAFET